MLGSHLSDAADEHAARTGHRVMHLPASADDVGHAGGDALRIAFRLLRELAEARGVHVQPLDLDGQLVGPQRKVRIEHLRLLRQRAFGAHHPAEPVRVTHSGRPAEVSAAGAGAAAPVD